jgi:hypothetical protein
MAEQLDMTVSGVWSRYRRARPPKPPRLGRWQQVLANALDENVAVGDRATVTDSLGRAPTRAELTAARRGAHSLAVLGRARVPHVPGADLDAYTGDRSYLVLAKPSVIMNDIRRRGWRFPGGSRSWQQESSGTFWTTGLNLPTAAPVVLMRWAGMICTQPEQPDR